MKYAFLLTILYGVMGVPIEDPDALQQFTAGNHKFTAAAYKEILKDEPDNFIVSPLAAELVLALVNEGAKGNTSAELEEALFLPSSKEKTYKALKSLLPNLKKNDDHLKLLNVNKIYADKSLILVDDFKTIGTTVYDTEVESISFMHKDKSSATINNWIEDNTNHKIKDLIEPKDIKDCTKAILVSGLYLSAKWVSPFEEHLTKKKKFLKTKNSSVDVATMCLTEYFNYYDSPTLNAKFLELPYSGADITMVIVLPNEKEEISSLEQNIEQLLTPQRFTKTKVNVELPKFTAETNIKWINVLWRVGIHKLFEFADLTGLASNFKDLYVSDLLQKTVINVTEVGTEATETTAVSADEKSAHDSDSDAIVFHADHPFVYFVKANGVILFIGRYTGP